MYYYFINGFALNGSFTINVTKVINITIKGKRRTNQDKFEYPDLHIKSRINVQNNI
jgi:hypothetical protein